MEREEIDAISKALDDILAEISEEDDARDRRKAKREGESHEKPETMSGEKHGEDSVNYTSDVNNNRVEAGQKGTTPLDAARKKEPEKKVTPAPEMSRKAEQGQKRSLSRDAGKSTDPPQSQTAPQDEPGEQGPWRRRATPWDRGGKVPELPGQRHVYRGTEPNGPRNSASVPGVQKSAGVIEEPKAGKTAEGAAGQPSAKAKDKDRETPEALKPASASAERPASESAMRRDPSASVGKTFGQNTARTKERDDSVSERKKPEPALGADEPDLDLADVDMPRDIDEYIDAVIEVTNEEARRKREELRRAGQARAKRKRRTVSSFKAKDAYAAAFFIPVIIMIVIFVQRKIFPFGEESFLRTDMYHQYAPFFSEFRYKLTHGGSLLYSWDIGMGVNFSALYAYYLASPLNWLLILCPKNLIIEFMTYGIVLKIGLCGLSFTYYLKKHCRTRDFGVAFFGIFYALSGYIAAYSWNIMWLDCIVLLPLIMLGLERLVKERKCGLYCMTLGACILSNYYISIMVCAFMAMYFVALLILERKGIGSCLISMFRFALYSLLAGGLAAIVLLPEIFALQLTASADFTFPQTYTAYFSIFDMLARHIGNVKVEIGLKHWPNIYCGVAVLMFFLMYLASQKVNLREKIVYCALLLIFFASFSVNVLNFIWHGFHYPNSLPARQSFIYIALILFICYRVYMNLEQTPWKHVVIAFWGSVCFVLLAQKLVTENHFHFSVYYVAILFLALYAGLIYLYQRGKASVNLVVVLALAVVSAEAAVNTTVTSVTTTSRTSYTKDDEAVRKLVDEIPKDSFYRVEKLSSKTKNDGAWMNYPSVSLFSSTANAGLTKLFKNLGCEASTNAYSITGSTPLVDSLFSAKYALYTGEAKHKSLLTFIDSADDIYLYQRAYTLPMAFGVPEDFEDNWVLDQNNPALAQNDLCDIIGAQRVLEETPGDTSGNTFRFTPQQAGEYYVYVTNKQVEKVTVALNGESKSFNNVNRGYFLELGYCEAGVEIKATADEPAGQELQALAYRFSEEGLKSVYEKLGQSPLVLTSWKDTWMEGTVDMAKSGRLLTTVPFEKGWTVWVDGVKRTPKKILGAFVSVDVPEGSHIIRMQYEPDGLKNGAYISGASLLLFAALMMRARRAKRKRDSSYEER